MNSSKTKKILIAFDGSYHSREAVRYVAGIPAFRRMEIVLFHVFTRIPDMYYDLKSSTPLGSRIKEVHAWGIQQENDIRSTASEMRRLFLDKGVPEKNIRITLHERENGIARDIIAESKKGYAALVVGRKGISRIKEFVMGGVAAKLLERINFMPLLLVGRKASPDRVLLALDNSRGAWKAVQFASDILCDSKSELLFSSVIRWDEERYKFAFSQIMEKRLEEATDIFVKAGLPRVKTKTLIISNALSRAEAICRTARDENYGTIIVGRRGLSKVEEFFIGRVSNKVVSLARDQAVWIVS